MNWWQRTWFWFLTTLALLGGVLTYVFTRRGPSPLVPPPAKQKEEEQKAEKGKERVEEEAHVLTDRIQEEAVEQRRKQVERLKRETELLDNTESVNDVLAKVSKEMRK